MDEVALAVQHDVAIVSVFDLQQEQQQAVGGHTADEVIPSLWNDNTTEILLIFVHIIQLHTFTAQSDTFLFQ